MTLGNSTMLSVAATTGPGGLLALIRSGEAVTRAQIMAVTGLSRSTVAQRLDALIAHGYIAPAASESSTGGRPPGAFQINADAGVMLLAAIGAGAMQVAVCDMSRTILARQSHGVSVADGPIAVLGEVMAHFDQLLAEVKRTRADVKGIGIGVPGLVDARSGRSYSSPVFGEREIPIAAMLGDRTGLPVKLEKPANLLALAESWFGYAQSEKSFAVVALDQTASLGLWVESDLHRGASTLGPTFGHVKVSGTGRTCDCGQTDCLNAYFSHAAMRRDAAARLGEAFAATTLARTDIVAALAEACDAGLAGARELVDEQGARLGMAVSHVVNLINPEKIIVALESARYSALVAPALKAAVEANSFRAHFAATQLIFHTLDEQLWARGAAALMLRDVYSAPWTSGYQEEKK